MPSHAHKRRRHAPCNALRVSKRAGASEPTCLSLRVGSDRQHVHATKDIDQNHIKVLGGVHSVVGGMNRGECIVCARVGPNQSTAATHNFLLAYVLIVQGLTAILRRPFGAPGSRPPTRWCRGA